MKTPVQPYPRKASRRLPYVLAQLSLLSALSACGGASDPVVQDSSPEVATRPSSSAAELSNDQTTSVSFAQAVAAGVVEHPGKSVSDTPAAANPDTSNPFTPIATSDSDSSDVTDGDSLGSTTNNTDDSNDTDSSDTKGSTATDFVAFTPATDSASSDNSGDDNSVSQGSDTADAGSENNSSNEPTATTDTSGADNSGDVVQAHFESHTSPGFVGDVLENTIRVNWAADPNARGYNVYRQAQFVKTVFSTEYIDTDVFDRDYYYEIQAFDHSDTLYYIATGLTVSARSFGRNDPDAPVVNTDILNGYEMVFSDEFNGSTLDSSKWNTSYLWGPDLIINSEEQYYIDIVNDPNFGYNPFTFDGDNLTINSIKTPPALASKAKNQPYLSGVITSYDAMKFTYGYIETRAKVTFGRGYWPAFWLLNAYYVDDKPEIDIMEFIGDDQDVVYHTYHYYDSDGQLRSTKSKPSPGVDYTDSFHTYGVEWKPNTLIFYIDGIEVHRVTDPKVSRQDMYVIANTALGGWWAGSPDESTPFPGQYTIDYIRVYQKLTPYADDVLLNDGITSLPFADDIPGERLPNHRPPFELWPQGYPDGL